MHAHLEGDDGGPWSGSWAGPWAGPLGGAKLWGHHGGRGPWLRARRGDVRAAILALLAERPMHGYEIIGELSGRTGGLWRPSPGSVYPTLQLLEDEGLVVSDHDSPTGKKRYCLTEDGHRATSEMSEKPAPWAQFAAGAPAGAKALRRAIGSLMPAIGQVMATGAPRQQEEAVAVLEEARRRMYAILAADQT